MDPKRRKTGDQDISELRLQSRQKYLAEREQTQLALLRKQVAEEAEEEERLGSKLSERERREFARNRETLRLAQARNDIDEHLDGFLIPDADYSSKSEILARKHKDKGYEKSEVQLWEDEQTKKVAAQVRRPTRVAEHDYEYVFDDSTKLNWVPDSGVLVDLNKKMVEKQLDELELKARTIEETRRSLPFYAYKDQLVEAVGTYQCLIVVGDTGSGKTTQMIQYLAEAGYAKQGRIACTQPRRVAAISVAARVAEEQGVRLGQEVGYNVRFESKTSEKTKMEFLTDGLLLALLKADASLSEYSVVILDEAHERTLATDILMGLLKDLLLVRPELKLIISSATLAAQKFSDYFGGCPGGCPILNIPGRKFPVSKMFASSPEANYLNAAVTTVFQIHLSQGPGDILVFLTGEDEIIAAADYINDTQKKLGNRSAPLIIAPVYGALPAEAQQLIFQPTPAGSRKVVLATNIAETSLTIDGIFAVIDCGLEKQSSYNAKLGMDQLVVVPCSRASAEQRAGRAGRTGPGMCFRLYTKYSFYNELPESTLPEINRASLDSVALTLKSMGIHDLISFDLMDKLDPTKLISSLETLYALGYLDSAGAVTKLGRRASELPLDPRLSKALLTADSLGCVEEVISLVAMLQEATSLFYAPKDKKAAADMAKQRFSSLEGGDMIMLLKVWAEFIENDDPRWCKENFVQYRVLNRVRDVREQLSRLCDRIEIGMSSCGVESHVPILKAFTAGYFANVARLNRDGQSYTITPSGLNVYIHPSSCLAKTRPKLLVFSQLVLTAKEYMRNVAPVEAAWLTEVAPHYHKKADIDALNVDKKMPKERSKTNTNSNMTTQTATSRRIA